MSAASLPRRGELMPDQRWDIESVFPDEAHWEAALAEATGSLGELAAYRGRLGESAETLLEALELRYDLLSAVGKVAVYSSLRFSEDATNPANGALAERGHGLRARFEAAVSYFEPEILAMDSVTLDRFMAENPAVAAYRHYFDKVGRGRGHVRSAEVEEVLAEAANL